MSLRCASKTIALCALWALASTPVDARPAEPGDHGRRFLRQQSERGLDDRADDRSFRHARKPTRPFNAELRAGMAGPFLGQIEIHDPDAAYPPHRENAADRNGHQRRDVRANGFQGVRAHSESSYCEG